MRRISVLVFALVWLSYTWTADAVEGGRKTLKDTVIANSVVAVYDVGTCTYALGSWCRERPFSRMRTVEIPEAPSPSSSKPTWWGTLPAARPCLFRTLNLLLYGLTDEASRLTGVILPLLFSADWLRPIPTGIAVGDRYRFLLEEPSRSRRRGIWNNLIR